MINMVIVVAALLGLISISLTLYNIIKINRNKNSPDEFKRLILAAMAHMDIERGIKWKK